MENKDIEVKVAKLEQRVETLEHEQKEMKDIVNDTRKIASSVEVMANEMKHMNEKIDDINSKVEHHHTDKPNQLMFDIKKAITTGIVGAIVGAVIALILK